MVCPGDFSRPLRSSESENLKGRREKVTLKTNTAVVGAIYSLKPGALYKHCTAAPLIWLQQASYILFLKSTDPKLLQLRFGLSILNSHITIIAINAGLQRQQKGPIRPAMTN